MIEQFELDKLQIASYRLADTIRGVFAGNHPVTTIDNARAISALLLGIYDYYRSQDMLPDISLASSPTQSHPELAQNIQKIRMLSNFTKHADRDANLTKFYFNTQSIQALRIACWDFEDVTRALVKNNLAAIDKNTLVAFGSRTGTTTDILCHLYLKWDREWCLYLRRCVKEGGNDMIPEHEREKLAAQMFYLPRQQLEKYQKLIAENGLDAVPENCGIKLLRTAYNFFPELKSVF